MITCVLNGCSHVKSLVPSWDQYIEKDKNFIREENTYLALLARKIYPNCKIINISDQGGSNERIFRTTAEYIFSSDIPKESLKIFIGWTHLHRLEVYCKEKTEWMKLTPGSDFFNEGIKPTEYHGIMRLMCDDVKQNSYLKLYKKILFELCKYNDIKLYSYDSMNFYTWAKKTHQIDDTGHFGVEAHQEYANILYDNKR